MDKISTIKENILQFIVNQNISKESFYKKTDISASNFKGNGLKSEIGGDKIVKILSIYPEIRPEWLLTGKGSMLKKDIDPPEVDDKINYKELAEARLEIIDGLKYKVAVLETQLSQTKSTTAFVPDFERELVK